VLTSKRKKIHDAEAVRLFTQEHLTMRQVGDRFGASGASVWKVLHRAGIRRQDGERATVTCDHCHRSFVCVRSRWRRGQRFCSSTCYFAFLKNPAFIQWRQGLRIARKVVAQHFDLLPEHTVHHADSNQCNNKIHNLWVFASKRDHHRFERGVDVQPIWKGSERF